MRLEVGAVVAGAVVLVERFWSLWVNAVVVVGGVDRCVVRPWACSLVGVGGLVLGRGGLFAGVLFVGSFTGIICGLCFFLARAVVAGYR